MALLNIIEMPLRKLPIFILNYVTNKRKRRGEEPERKCIRSK